MKLVHRSEETVFRYRKYQLDRQRSGNQITDTAGTIRHQSLYTSESEKPAITAVTHPAIAIVGRRYDRFSVRSKAWKRSPQHRSGITYML